MRTVKPNKAQGKYLRRTGMRMGGKKKRRVKEGHTGGQAKLKIEKRLLDIPNVCDGLWVLARVHMDDAEYKREAEHRERHEPPDKLESERRQ